MYSTYQSNNCMLQNCYRSKQKLTFKPNRHAQPSLADFKAQRSRVDKCARSSRFSGHPRQVDLAMLLNDYRAKTRPKMPDALALIRPIAKNSI